jgi:hypothetical protein
MRSRPASRLRAALLGIWFLVAGREPPFAHPCPMGGHGARPAVATVPARETPTVLEAGGGRDAAAAPDDQAAAHAHHAHDVPGAHPAHPALHGAAPEPATSAPHAPAERHSTSGHGDCQCVTDCCGAPVPTVADARLSLVPPHTVVVDGTLPVARHERLASAPHHLRPFAIGPPAVVA